MSSCHPAFLTIYLKPNSAGADRDTDSPLKAQFAYRESSIDYSLTLPLVRLPSDLIDRSDHEIVYYIQEQRCALIRAQRNRWGLAAQSIYL